MLFSVNFHSIFICQIHALLHLPIKLPQDLSHNNLAILLPVSFFSSPFFSKTVFSVPPRFVSIIFSASYCFNHVVELFLEQLIFLFTLYFLYSYLFHIQFFFFQIQLNLSIFTVLLLLSFWYFLIVITTQTTLFLPMSQFD